MPLTDFVDKEEFIENGLDGDDEKLFIESLNHFIGYIEPEKSRKKYTTALFKINIHTKTGKRQLYNFCERLYDKLPPRDKTIMEDLFAGIDVSKGTRVNNMFATREDISDEGEGNQGALIDYGHDSQNSEQLASKKRRRDNDNISRGVRQHIEGLGQHNNLILKEVRDLKELFKKFAKESKKGGNTPVAHQEIVPRKSVRLQPTLEGEGVVSAITNLGKKAYRKTKETASKIASTAKDVATKVITGNTGMPPNVKSMLNKYGDNIISGLTIARNPVGSALISALNVASMGDFKKNLDNSPYDKLFHLKLIITLQNGIKLAFEKVERVSLTKYIRPDKGQEDEEVSVDKQITLGQLYHNAEIVMGDRFYPYSARDNNCQNFILSVLKASGLGGERDFAFIKQDTQSLFGDESFLRKLSNTITDIGARFNVLLQGGKVDLKNLRQSNKGRGVRKVYPPDYQPKDFISLPPYLQNDALAGNVVLGDNTPDDDGESGTGVGLRPHATGGDIEKGAFRKSFYQRQAKYKHLKTLDAYARYIVSHPKDFSMKVRKRAQFLINVH